MGVTGERHEPGTKRPEVWKDRNRTKLELTSGRVSPVVENGLSFAISRSVDVMVPEMR